MNTCTSCLLQEEGELLQSQRFMYIPYSLGYKVKMMTLEKVEIFKYTEELTLCLCPMSPD